MLEVPQNADPMEDQFEKKANLKSEKVAKNELQRMRNIVRAKKGTTPRTGYLGSETASSKDVSEHFTLPTNELIVRGAQPNMFVSLVCLVIDGGHNCQGINSICR